MNHLFGGDIHARVSNVGQVEPLKQSLHLDLLDCEAASMIQSSPLNNLLMSSNEVARNFGFTFEPVARLVPALSLDAVGPRDVRLGEST